MTNTRYIEVKYDNNKLSTEEVHKVLEILINSTPTGKLRNKLCDANIEVMSLIENENKKETNETATTNNP